MSAFSVDLQDFLNKFSVQDLAPELRVILGEIAKCCVEIQSLTQLGKLSGIHGSADSENIQGESQKQMDVVSNDLLIERLKENRNVAAIASEEMDDIVSFTKEETKGSYLVAFDPLDGSSNIDINVSVGTIFSIGKKETNGQVQREDFLYPGKRQLAAGYCLYGPSTILVISFGQGTHAFTYSAQEKRFLLTDEDIQIPVEAAEYAINSSYRHFWFEPTMTFVENCEAGKSGPYQKTYNMRWVASMVAEIHRILCRGGVFLYPSNEKIQAQGQQGKLRLLYEANPMAMLVEQAGGMSSTGLEDIMDIGPEDLHQRVPVIMGSANEVQRAIDCFKR